MSAQRYRVVFSGEILPGLSRDEVKMRLAKSFKMPPERLDAYFTGRPMVLKSDLDAAGVDRFQRAFRAAGGVLRVQLMPDPAPPAPEVAPPPPATPPHPVTATPPARMTCPRCNTEQAHNESCANCGVIIAKARQRLAAPAEEAPAPPPLAPSSPPAAAAREAAADPPARVAPPPPTPAPEADEAGSEDGYDAAGDELSAPGAAAKHPPLIATARLSVVSFLATCITAGLLHLFLIGILFAPRMVWDFIMSHVYVDDRRLHNADLWLGLRPLLWLPACLAAGLAAAIPAGLVLALLGMVSQRLTMGVAAVFSVAVGMVMLAPLQLGVIRSLVGHTTSLDGDRLFTQPFAVGWTGIRRYLVVEWQPFLLGGAALFCNLIFFTTPLGTAITLSQFFNRMESNGHRLQVEVPWKKALIFSLLAIPSLGFANLFFIRYYIHEVVPSGIWVPVGGDVEH